MLRKESTLKLLQGVNPSPTARRTEGNIMELTKSHHLKMAKNIAVLKNKSTKKYQAHLLCQSLILLLKTNGKDI